jgi:hypothetical protein
MQRDIVHRHRLQAEFAFAFHFHAVDADVLLTKVVRIDRIAGDNAGFIEIETAIAIVQTKQRQDIEQVNLFTIDGIFRPRRVCAALRCDREGIPAAINSSICFFTGVFDGKPRKWRDSARNRWCSSPRAHR